MRATTQLPENYEQWRILNIQQDKRLQGVLTLLCAAGLIFFGVLFWSAASALSPSLASTQSGSFEIRSFLPLLIGLLIIVGVFLFVLTIHEAIHGLFFWLYTRDRPKFGFKWIFAYASAPQWYIPRTAFLVIGIAPFLAISIVAMLLFLLLPFTAAIIVVFAAALNAGGAVGDFYVIGWILANPTTIMLRDYGDGITMYRLIDS